jgi:hypothetical protein
MTNGKKILLIAGIVAVGVGGFALTMYLTKNFYEKKMSIIYKKDVEEIVQDYDVFNDPKVE